MKESGSLWISLYFYYFFLLFHPRRIQYRAGPTLPRMTSPHENECASLYKKLIAGQVQTKLATAVSIKDREKVC
jgi:hypothetical protein